MSLGTNYDDVQAQLRGFGLHGKEVDSLEFGRMQRCFAEGDREKRGWYALHQIPMDDGDLLIVGSYGIWHANNNNAQKIEIAKGRKLSDEQQAALKKRWAEDKKKAEAARQREAEKAAARATIVWKKCAAAGDSEYLKRKGVQGHGVRFSDSGAICIPMQDNQGRVHGLQFILPPGHPRREKNHGRDKEFWPAGLAKKGHYFLIGMVRDVVLVAEGYATAATIHEATGLPVAVAFDAGNLAPVCDNLRKRFKRAPIYICADDDFKSEGNPGVSAAGAAALGVDGTVIIPKFTVDREKGKKGLTDFNDLHLAEGLDVVRDQISARVVLSGNAAATAAGALDQGGGAGMLKPLLDVQEAVERYALIYGAGGTMFDFEEHDLIPKSDVLDICVDHAWREWKLAPMRKVVRLSEVGFDPTEKDTTIRCNLWAGWPTKPKSGSCEYLLDLLRYLCSNEDADKGDRSYTLESSGDYVYKWVLKWLAYPLQHPGAKMKTALVFHGPQGTGKNLFFEAYAAIYGKYGRIVDQAAIDDKFNDWASKKLFLIADEVVARQELFHIKNKLKALITGDWIRINPKNVAAHEERNHVNLAFLSNEKQPLVLEKDDRRYAVIYTPEKLPPELYKDIASEVRDGGVAALYDYLLHLDLGDFDEHAKPPLTQSKQDLIEINKSSEDWFIDAWLLGDLGLPVCPAETQDLYRAYQEFCKRHGVIRPRDMAQFIGHIGKLGRGWKKNRRQVFDDWNMAGDPRQKNIIEPPDESVDEKFKADGKRPSVHFTESILTFREAVNGQNG